MRRTPEANVLLITGMFPGKSVDRLDRKFCAVASVTNAKSNVSTLTPHGTYILFASYEAFCVLLSCAVSQNLSVDERDVASDYVYGKIEFKVYF